MKERHEINAGTKTVRKREEKKVLVPGTGQKLSNMMTTMLFVMRVALVVAATVTSSRDGSVLSPLTTTAAGNKNNNKSGGDNKDNRRLEGVRVIVTTPPSYSDRLAGRLRGMGCTVVLCPTVSTGWLDDDSDFRNDLLGCDRGSSKGRELPYDYVAFTSRRGIQAAIRTGGNELIEKLRGAGDGGSRQHPVAIALGADSTALTDVQVPVIVPSDASPSGIVQELCNIVPMEQRKTTKVLCPVPLVTGGLDEPSVVPNFLRDLRNAGFHVVSCPAYVTSWTGLSEDRCRVVKSLSCRDEGDGHHEHDVVDVIAITSTAEAQGLLLMCQKEGVDLRRDCLSRVILAAHGPVTAKDIEDVLQVKVDVISKDYSSFNGLCIAIAEHIEMRQMYTK